MQIFKDDFFKINFVCYSSVKNIFVFSGEEDIIILGDFNLNPEKEGK